MIIKICGITTEEDLRWSVEGGARALGFNFYPGSPRYLEIERARGLLEQVPEGILRVAVIVLEDGEPVGPTREELESLPLDVYQVHGAGRGEDLPATNREIWVATSPTEAVQFPDHRIVIDTSWGRGEVADWEAVERLERPVILSGGLTPENVAEALRRLSPEGVDVCSGVESEPGRKDPVRLKQFLQIVGRPTVGRPSRRSVDEKRQP